MAPCDLGLLDGGPAPRLGLVLPRDDGGVPTLTGARGACPEFGTEEKEEEEEEEGEKDFCRSRAK